MSEADTDIALRDSLELLGEAAPRESSTIRYGDLVLSIAPKANTLLADHLFSPSLLLAERIERGLISFPNQTLVELGAGCALPSLLASTLTTPPSLVVATDYPAPEILSNVHANVARNKHLVQQGCRVVPLGYEWGTDPSSVLATLPESAQDGFDAVILSDLLHFSSSHSELVTSLTALLARRPSSRVYVATGKYTAWNICEAFLAESSAKGIAWSPECSAQDLEHGRWCGNCVVEGLSGGDLGVRKANCWWWMGRWHVD